MIISDILDPERVVFGVDAGSKKKVLEKMSELLATAEQLPDTRCVFDNLCARERLGSTGLGHGVAIPHCRLPTLKHAVGAMLKVNHAVDFDAPDGQPVDLVFGLAVPEECTEEHLEILAALAQTFSQCGVRESLRTEELTSEDVCQLIRAAEPGV